MVNMHECKKTLAEVLLIIAAVVLILGVYRVMTDIDRVVIGETQEAQVKR